MIRPALRRGLAEKAVARHGISIALACRTFDVSETCYRYSPLLSDENEEIADLLVGLTPHGRLGGLGYVSCIYVTCKVIRGTTKGFTGFTANWN